jgi:hypothetical protein
MGLVSAGLFVAVVEHLARSHGDRAIVPDELNAINTYLAEVERLYLSLPVVAPKPETTDELA